MHTRTHARTHAPTLLCCSASCSSFATRSCSLPFSASQRSSSCRKRCKAVQGQGGTPLKAGRGHWAHDLESMSRVGERGQCTIVGTFRTQGPLATYLGSESVRHFICLNLQGMCDLR